MLPKQLEVKRKHHHVWADYLRRWSHDGNNLFYSTENKKIVCESVRGVAMEKDFYQITALTPEQVKIIRKFSEKSEADLHKTHMSYLNKFLIIQRLEETYFSSGRSVAEIDKSILAMKCNTLEDLHAAHERKVRPILSTLASGDLEILNDNGRMIDFMIFFGHQIARTKNFRDCVIRTAPTNNETERYIANTMRHSWWFMSYMFGMNMGRSFYLSRNKNQHSLLINETDVSFITSDQPIINVHECVNHDKLEAPEFGDFYYPISPQVAYLISESNQIPSGRIKVGVKLVEEFNFKIARRANVHVFGDSEKAVSAVISYIGDHQRKFNNG